MKKLFLSVVLLFSLSMIQAQDLTWISECVISNGNLMEVKVQYERSTGKKYVEVKGVRKNFEDVYPSNGKDYAAAADWYINNETIKVNGNNYRKYGLPRVLGIGEISKSSTFKGVSVYVEAGSSGTPEVIYIPVRTGCEFQPFIFILPECGELIIKTNIKEVKAGGSIVCTATITGSKGKMEYFWETNGEIISGEESAKATISSSGVKKELSIELYVNDQDQTCESMKYVVIPIK